jgi:hypothetical protein
MVALNGLLETIDDLPKKDAHPIEIMGEAVVPVKYNKKNLLTN